MRDHAYLAKGYSVASKFACARKVRSTYIVFPQRQMSAELVARLVFLSCLLGCIATDSAQEEVEETRELTKTVRTLCLPSFSFDVHVVSEYFSTLPSFRIICIPLCCA